MKIQHGNLLMASTKLWVEHTLLTKGEAFNNFTGFFYDIKETFNGLYTYALPYQPLIGDTSVPNANVMSGIYLDGVFISPGQSGLYDINFEKGQVYFTSEISNSHTRLSGRYAVGEFNVSLTDKPEETLLFETKHELKPQASRTVTGLNPNETTFPIIYLKSFGGRNDPFAFGGTEKQITNVRMIVFADSQFAADGVASIFKDKVRSIIPLATGLNEIPYNSFGGWANGAFSYSGFASTRHEMQNSMYLNEVSVSALPGSAYAEIRNLSPFAFITLVDLEIENYRNPRE